MFVESLDSRRLFAVTTALAEGVLTINGTDESETIHISAAYRLAAVADRGTEVVSGGEVNSYVVSVDGKPIGTFAGKEVDRINIFAKGGNDRITGPQGKLTIGSVTRVDEERRGPRGQLTGDSSSVRYGTIVIDAGSTDLQTVTLDTAPLYIEGGSGRDRITGSTGRDTIKGGRGNDDIVDTSGRNYLDGGAGDDKIVTIGTAKILNKDGNSYAVSFTAPSGISRILGGAGNDTVGSSADDILLDTPEVKSLTIAEVDSRFRRA